MVQMKVVELVALLVVLSVEAMVLDSALASQQKSTTECAMIISRLRRIFVGSVKVTIEAVDRRSDLLWSVMWRRSSITWAMWRMPRTFF
jgi:hypothetical protein